MLTPSTKTPVAAAYTGVSNSPAYIRGPNSGYQPASAYPRVAYSGPVQVAASGAYVPKTALTSRYPRSGVKTVIIVVAARPHAVSVAVAINRPYVHMCGPKPSPGTNQLILLGVITDNKQGPNVNDPVP